MTTVTTIGEMASALGNLLNDARQTAKDMFETPASPRPPVEVLGTADLGASTLGASALLLQEYAQRVANSPLAQQAQFAGAIANAAAVGSGIAKMSDALLRHDTDQFATGLLDVIGGGAGLATLFPPFRPVGTAIALGALGAKIVLQNNKGELGNAVDDLHREFERTVGPISREVNDRFSATKSWILQKDPLVLDLDGDGIEATGINSSLPVLFDHDADGIKTATGWIHSDDGIVVFDRDGNSLIDSGRELFGDNTLLASGELATNGYTAIAELDVNADNRIDQSDTAFNQLRLWRDTNQDGISQADELATLTAAGIASIETIGSPTNINLGNGNTQPFSATFLRTNGTVGESGTPELSGSLLLASNNFYREFTDDAVVTAAAAALPQMRGSGEVRDLREAASLGTSDGAQLEAMLAQFAQAQTRDTQYAAVEPLVHQWGLTSGFADAKARYGAPGPSSAPHISSAEAVHQFANANPDVYARISTLERFNGDPIFERFVFTRGGVYQNPVTGEWVGYSYSVVEIHPQQQELLDSAWAHLTESIYGSLVLQTRLARYIDSIELVIDSQGLHFDCTDMQAMLTSRRATNEREGLIDLIELNKFAQSTLEATGFDGMTILRGWVDDLAVDSPLRAELASFGLYMGPASQGSVHADLYIGDSTGRQFNAGSGNDVIDGGAGADQFDGGAGNDLMAGNSGNDTLLGKSGDDRLHGGQGDDGLYGGEGADQLVGGQGTDILNGGSGADRLDGGAGNDDLSGGSGNNTYLFGLGDGLDLVRCEQDPTATRVNTLQFKAGTTPSQITLKQVTTGNAGPIALELAIAGTSDAIRIEHFFHSDDIANPYNPIQQVSFEDGTAWSQQDILNKLLAGTAGNDTFRATFGADTINGQAGDDALNGAGGDDAVHGGDGNDSLYGDAGADQLFGGAGTDTLNGGLDNDTFDGGAGNDDLSGGAGNNVYLFGLGDGVDLIRCEQDQTASRMNTLQFKSGVAASQITFKQVTTNGNAGPIALELGIAGTGDAVRIEHFFHSDDPGNPYNPVQQVRFDDGTTWSHQDILDRLLAGTAGNDSYRATGQSETLQGLEGDDTLNGAGGDDVVNGGDGSDTLYGDAGADQLLGGQGADTLNGGSGNDVFDGGVGNDDLSGGSGNNTYLFGLGDGQDLIRCEQDPTATRINTLQFKAGITAAQITVKQVTTNSNAGPIALELGVQGTSDWIRIEHFFHSGDPTNQYNPIQRVEFADGTVWDYATITAKFLQGTLGNDSINGTSASENISGGDGNDTLNGMGGDDVVNGDAGNDTVYGEHGADQLFGGAGTDTLNGGTGNDVFDGGAGNDDLSGGSGNNTYLFGVGDGQDLIRCEQDPTATRVNTLQFKANVAASQILLTQEDIALRFRIEGTNDSILVQHFFHSDNLANPYNPIQQVKFDDGTTWAQQDILNVLLAGTSGNDTVRATAAAETLYGLAGNDTLNGAGGDDVVHGGDGDDTLYGDNGADQLFGGLGSDTINGGSGADIFDGGAGSDDLRGSSGNNTYLFGLGDGQDLIRCEQDTTATRVNSLQFKAGIAASQIILVRDDIALRVCIQGTTDSVLIQHFFHSDNPANPYNPIQQIRFDDGTTWSQQDIVNKLLAGTAGNDTFRATTAADTLHGQAGNDTLNGAAGDDAVHGGDGNDTLYGDSGADQLFGGLGTDTLNGGTGDDVFDGGGSNDDLSGGSGNNTYLFGVGDGVDLIRCEQDQTASRVNTLQFKSGVATSQITLKQVTTNGNAGPIALELGIAGTSDAVRIEHFFHSDNPANPYNPIQQVKFDDGTTWSHQDILNQLLTGTAGNDTFRATTATETLDGLGGDDTLNGAAGDDAIHGGDGDDYLYGEGGADLLFGGAGVDRLWGGAGNDTLDGGAGNDQLNAGSGNNTYLFGLGEGQDLIVTEQDTTSGRMNTLQFKAGITTSQIVLSKVTTNGNAGPIALQLAIHGTGDAVRIEHFFHSGTPTNQYNPVQQVRFDDGTVWTTADIEVLILGTPA